MCPVQEAIDIDLGHTSQRELSQGWDESPGVVIILLRIGQAYSLKWHIVSIWPLNFNDDKFAASCAKSGSHRAEHRLSGAKSGSSRAESGYHTTDHRRLKFTSSHAAVSSSSPAEVSSTSPTAVSSTSPSPVSSTSPSAVSSTSPAAVRSTSPYAVSRTSPAAVSSTSEKRTKKVLEPLPYGMCFIVWTRYITIVQSYGDEDSSSCERALDKLCTAVISRAVVSIFCLHCMADLPFPV